MIEHLLTLPCTLVLRTSTGATNDHGEEVMSTQEVDTVCEFQQRGRTEPTTEGASARTTGDQGDLSVTSWLLVLPAGCPAVDSGDQVVIGDLIYEFVGAPWRARNPVTGVESHVECTVVRTAGQDTPS